jgi:hypothetical protein
MAIERRAGDVERGRGSDGLGNGSEFMEGLVNVRLAKPPARGTKGIVGVLTLL